VDYYGALNVTTGSNSSEIKTKYRRLALQYHPDKLGGLPKKQQKVRATGVMHGQISSRLIVYLYTLTTSSSSSRHGVPCLHTLTHPHSFLCAARRGELQNHSRGQRGRASALPAFRTLS